MIILRFGIKPELKDEEKGIIKAICLEIAIDDLQINLENGREGERMKRKED